MSNRSVYCRAKSILRVLCVAFPCVALGLVGSPAFGQNESQFGKWEPPPAGLPDIDDDDGGHYGWPLVPIDAALLSTGKVLVWQHDPISSPRLWNPADGKFAAVPCNSCVGTLHCPDHAFLVDGSLLVPGGGPPTTNETRIFRLTGAWEQAAWMHIARFYPTSTTLPTGGC